MKNYFLEDYNLTSTQVAYSCVLSEYGLRHLKTAWKEKDVTHGLIALLELTPLVGPILSIAERVLASQYYPLDPTSIPPSFIRFKVLKIGSQNGCNGFVETEKAKKICERLNQKPSNGIHFSKSRLINTINMGTCSAMAFDFANRYIEMRKTLSPEEVIERIGSDYEHSSQEFRTMQAALDTIHKKKGAVFKDFNQAKMEAMLRFYGRRVIKASEIIDLTQKSMLAKTRKILRDFQQGIFILRIIRPHTNDKGEHYGHTAVLIRDGDKQYFYDPGKGVSEIEQGYESTTLCDALLGFKNMWYTYLGRIYQIT